MRARIALALALLSSRAFAAEESPGAAPLDEPYSAHGQVTLITQAFPASHSRTAGTQTFGSDAGSVSSLSASLSLGLRATRWLEVYAGPETEGRTFESAPHGLAAYPNLDLFQTEDPERLVAIPPVFARATISLGGDRMYIAPASLRLGAVRASRRLELTGGLFSVHDVLARPKVAGEAQETFVNAGIARAGAFDAPATDVGLSAGVAAALVVDAFALRATALLMPDHAHGEGFDTDVGRAHGFAAEAEHDHGRGAWTGAVRYLAFANTGNLGSYALAAAAAPVSLASARAYGRWKVGFVVALDQQLGAHAGAFVHASASDGHDESVSYLETDRSVAAGVTADGAAWRRRADVVGLAAVVSGLSSEHRLFLARGGSGPVIGNDGPRLGAEWAFEAFYRFALTSWLALGADYQLFVDPGYDRDRTPLHLFGGRARGSF